MPATPVLSYSTNMKTAGAAFGIDPARIREIAVKQCPVRCPVPAPGRNRTKLTEFEAAVLTALRLGYRTAHDIAAVSGVAKPRVGLLLAALKRKGAAMQLGTHGQAVARQEWCAIKRPV